NAAFYLGLLYSRGTDIDQDFEEAVRWFREAAFYNHAGAIYELATAYAQGRGVRQNARDAFFWYHVAADAGHPQPMRELGSSYQSGLGVARDESAAAEWFAKAERADPVEGQTRPVAARMPEPRAQTGRKTSSVDSALAAHTLMAEDSDGAHSEAPLSTTAK